jgi:hypothetical protein
MGWGEIMQRRGLGHITGIEVKFLVCTTRIEIKEV